MHPRHRPVLWSTLGFGVGGLIGGSFGDALILGLGLMGAIGGATLAWSIGRPTWTAAMLGFVGFLLGFGLGFFIVLAVWEPPLVGLALVGAAGGAFGGFALAIAWGRLRRMGLRLAAYGAVGFGVGFLLIEAGRRLGFLFDAGLVEVDGAAVFVRTLGAAVFTGLAAALGGAVLGWGVMRGRGRRTV